ncbi:MAG: Ig-like domain-containing protein, partial [Bacilli bacterium]|nr:Ig-like domain-containing protein [Bacilli bacterium]
MKKFFGFFSLLCLALILVACGGIKLSFEQEEITIMIGDEVVLEPVISDDTLTLEWSSSELSVVKVDDSGKISGISVGSAEITVGVKDKKVSATIKVIVKEYDAELSFDKETVNLALGTSLTLVPIVTPQRELTFAWTSEKEEIATVDQKGKVSPLAVGTTEITVSARGKSASITVNVVIPDPVSIVISGYDSTIVKALSTLQLEADVIPMFAIQGVEWSTSDVAVATVDETGLVSFVGLGEVTITAAATVKAEVLNTVTFVVAQPDPVSITVTAEDDKTEIAVFEGVLLSAVAEPELAAQTVTWSVSDDTIGQVNANGYFTGLSGGKVTVYAASTVDETVVGSLEITVYIPDPESISVVADYDVLMVDEEMEFQVNLLPAAATQTVTYESSDDQVVTVDANGKAVAVGTGEAVITIKSTVKETIAATYNIKVVAKITEIDASYILVDAALEAERFSTITVDSHEFIVGINALTDIVAAFELIEEGSTVIIKAGTYDSNLKINSNNVTVIGPNSNVNPVTNLETRKEEADIQGQLTLGAAENIVIKGLKFSGKGQIYSILPQKNHVFENLYYDQSSVDPAQGVVYLGLKDETYVNENILIKNCSFNDTKGGGYRGVRINNAKDLTVEGCYFYRYYDAVRLEGTDNSSWGTNMGTGSGAAGVLNIVNNKFENNIQYPIVVTRYTATEVNITDNYLGVAEGLKGVYGLINLVNYIKGDYKTVVNILRNEIPYCTEYHDIRLKSNGATEEDITFNVNYNIWHQKPYLEPGDSPSYDFHIAEHTDGVPVNAQYNVFLYEGGPQPEFFHSRVVYEPYFTSVDELENYLYGIFVDTAWAEKAAGDTIEYNNYELVFGEKAFATISDALEAAPAGSIIIVLPGVYDEAVVVDKAITLKTLNAASDPTENDAVF